MFLRIIGTIWNVFNDLVGNVLNEDWVFLICLGITVLLALIFFIKAKNSYEWKLNKTADKLNEWLFKNRNIKESNLIEFNNIIKAKSTPKILRKYWQQYMLYRDKAPSEYISSYNCIDKPLKTSSLTADIKNFSMITKFIAVISFFLTAFALQEKTNIAILLTHALISSTIILFFATVVTFALRAMQNNNIATLYQTFSHFTRSIDRASTTIPKYVDFEVLFTAKEIHDGIPILGEYLEKRARQEQEELEAAQKDAVKLEEYDFSQSGIDGSLVLDRAMKESTIFINTQNRLLAEIQQFETEISTLKKNFENTSKDVQRKLQASRENMERLRQQQEESTNRIEVNYIRKQLQDEVKKQEQLEKEQEDSTNKFNNEINSFNIEIEKRREEIETKKQKVQESMLAEYQTFSEKLHRKIVEDVQESKEDAINEVVSEKDKYAQAISYLKNELDGKDELLKQKEQTINELALRLQEYLGQEVSIPQTEINEPQEVQETQDNQEESDDAEGHYDEKGYYWFNNGTYYDANNLYHDLEGNVYDADGNLVSTNQVVETENQSPSDAGVVETNQPTPVEEVSEKEETPSIVEEEKVEEPENLVIEEQPKEEVKQEEVADNTTTEEEKEPKKTKEKDSKEESKDEKPKSKRVGRPKKEVSEEELNKPKRGVGRPKKDPNEETKPKRKVGRPKKEVSEEELNKPKRKVGRPKKDA